MSFKSTFSNYSKSLAQKILPIIKNLKTKTISLKEDYIIYPKNKPLFNDLTIIHRNIKKYCTSVKQYQTFIINSIIFDQRIHKVAVFKNNLLWDESSEFLKRFYKKKESIERIPKISEYYEKYTLFPPVYFGFEGLIIIIMNKWTKRKKTYLEYIEDHEDEKEAKKEKKKNVSFEPLISPSLLTNKASSKSIISKNTLDLSKLDNEINKNDINNKNNIGIKNKINNYIKETNKINKVKKKENISSLSFSEIIDDLSSHYSVIIQKENKNNNKIYDTANNKKKKQDKKYRKSQNTKSNKKSNKKEGRNGININKARNTYNNMTNNSRITNMTKISQMKTTLSPRKKIKICLNKKKNKYILVNKNTNIIERNGNMPFPSDMKKFQKKIMNTENHFFKVHNLPINGGNSTKNNNSKGTIRVNTISNYLTEKNKIINNNILQKREEIYSSKKPGYNFIKNINKKNTMYINKKKYSCSTINNASIQNSKDKNLDTINYNIKNIIKQKNSFQIKRKSLIETNNTSNSINNQHWPLTYRNSNNQPFNYLKERPSVSNLVVRTTLSKEKQEKPSNKDKNSIQKNNSKKLYLEDPFIYKLTQLTKKKQISITNTNSLSKIKDSKNFTHYGINSIIENTNNYETKTNSSNNNFNTNNLKKINNRKNLVLTKLNSKKQLIYNNKSKLLGEDIIRNNSTSLHKNRDHSINLNFPGQISNSHSYRPNKINNSKNINLNLNLNIHFNIDVENKNKGKKIVLNKAIINQLNNRINKNQKFSTMIRNKDNSCQYPLTSKNSKRYLNDLNLYNKKEFTILKKF